MSARELLKRLVSIPSVSGRESDAVKALVAEGSRLGFRAGIDAAGNGVLERGERGEAIELVLLGHIDTVPGEIPVRVEGGELWGRGSVDAKGSLVTFVCAASRASIPAGCRVVVVGAVEEEVSSSAGARHIASTRTPNACIIGEPSGADGVTLGYKGRLIAEHRVESDCAHSAADHASAAEEVVRWWQRVEHTVHALNGARVGAFDRLQARLDALDGSSDGMRESATARVGLRLPPWIGPGELGEHLERCDRVGTTQAWGGETAWRSDRNDLVARSLTASIRASGEGPRPRVKTGTSDMNVVAPVWGCPIAAYGPGDSAMDHTPHERLPLDELDRAVGVVADAIERILGELLSQESNSAEVCLRASTLSDSTSGRA